VARARAQRKRRTTVTLLIAAAIGVIILLSGQSPQVKAITLRNMDQEQLRDVVRRSPNDAQAHSFLGLRSFSAGDLEEAIKAFQRAAELDRRNPMPHAHMAMVFANLGNVQEAFDAAQRALVLDPKLAPAHKVLGDIYARERHYVKAIAEYRLAMETGGNDGRRMKFLIAECYRKAKDYDRAEPLYREMLEAPIPDMALQARVGLGWVLYHRGRISEAKARFASVGGPYSSFNPPELTLGRALIAAREPGVPSDETLATVRKCIDLFPKSSLVPITLAQLHERRNENGPAERYYREAIKRNDRDMDAYYGLGRLLLRTGRTREGQDLLRRWDGEKRFQVRATQLQDQASAHPQDVRVRLELARHFEDHDDVLEASGFYREALSLDPGSVAAREGLQRLKARAEGAAAKPGARDPEGVVAGY
jgi:tetratricopeptide (TPR) repeat protein